MLHEAKHLSQPMNRGHESLPFEVDADRGGIGGYHAAIALGVQLNPVIPEFTALLREVGSLPQMGSEIYTMLKEAGLSPTGRMDGRAEQGNALPSHSTHAFINSDHDHENAENVAAQKFLAMQRVKSFVNVIVGQQEMTVQLSEIQSRLSQPGAKVTDADSDLVQRSVGQGAFFEMHLAGSRAVQDDPAKGYNVIKALHQSGYFKEGSEEARYIGRVNAFLETHAPTYISEPERIEARRELVSSLEQIKGVIDIPTVELPEQEMQPSGKLGQPRPGVLPQMGR
jgi:hypothetical protein